MCNLYDGFFAGFSALLAIVTGPSAIKHWLIEKWAQLLVSKDGITEPQQCWMHSDGLVTIDGCVPGERLYNMRD